MVESSEYTVNPYYGDPFGIHNDGHDLIATLGNAVRSSQLFY
jgi:hypothetical protein